MYMYMYMYMYTHIYIYHELLRHVYRYRRQGGQRIWIGHPNYLFASTSEKRMFAIRNNF